MLLRFALFVSVFFSGALSVDPVLADIGPFTARPYRVLIQVAAENPESLRAAFAESVVSRCEIRSRGLWRVEMAWLPPTLAQTVAESYLAPPESWEAFDKVFLVSYLDEQVMTVQEFDVTTRRLGEKTQNGVEHPAKWGDILEFALFRQFSPLTRLDKASSDQADFLLRGVDILTFGGSEPLENPDLVLHSDGVLLPIVRTEDAQGRCLAVTPVPWTALTVKDIDLPSRLVRCRIESGLRGSLSSRRRGNTAIYGLSVPAPQRATTLQFLTRQGAAMPRGLGVYDIFEAVPGETALRRIGRSDLDGRFILEPDPLRPVRICYVKSGNALLARLPVVRGLDEILTVPVPDDPVRLRAEAALIGLQEEFIDTQARREILTLRLEKTKNDKAAQAVRLELAKLKDRPRFLTDLEQAQLRFRSDDSAVQRRIDRMFRETKKVFETP